MAEEPESAASRGPDEEPPDQEADREARRRYVVELKRELHGGGLLTAAEVAEILEVHPRTVAEYIRTGALPAYQLGGAWKVAEATLRAFLRRQVPPQAPSGPAAKAAPTLPWRKKAGGFRCSFCGKGREDVRRLVAGPNVFICDECVGLCNEIIAGESDVRAADGATP